MNDKKENTAEEIKVSSPLSAKLENFWYHYKWHSIAAVVVIAITIVLVLQTCSRVSYDGYILYAGPYEIKQTSQNGDIAPYAEAISSLKKVCSDYDNDGNVNVTLQNLFVLNDEEANEMYEINPGQSINTSLVQEDTKTLGQVMLYGDYYVCFLSERLFLEYEEKYNGALFSKVGPYINAEKEYELCSERGIYLRSLDIYSLPELCNLPDDTVVCLRSLSEVSSKLNKAESERNFAMGEALFKNIVNYSK